MKRKIKGTGNYYAYVIIWDDRYYIGSRTSNNSNPQELFSECGKNYTTSSKVVKRYLNDVGKPKETRQYLFKTKKEAFNFETRLLNRLDAKNNPKFLNLHNNEGTNVIRSYKRNKNMFPATNGIETIQMLNDDPRFLSGEYWGCARGTVNVVDSDNNHFRVKMDDPRYLSGELKSHCHYRVGEKNSFYGKKHTEETRKKISENRLKNNGGVYHLTPCIMSENAKKEASERMKKNNPMFDEKVKAEIHKKRSETVKSFSYWRERFVVKKYDNWEEIEKYIKDNINNILPSALYKSFDNVKIDAARVMVKRYKGEFNNASSS